MISQQTIAELRDKLTAITDHTGFILPELCLAGLILVLVLFDIIFKQRNQFIFTITGIAGLMLTIFLVILQWELPNSLNKNDLLFHGMIQPDMLAAFFKILFAFTGIITLLTSISYRTGSIAQSYQKFTRIGEYYGLLTAVILGAFMLSMTTHLLFIYLSIELISLSSYVLTSFNFNKKSMEASLKYILYGAVASGIMLYGMSLLYGLTGSLQLNGSGFLKGLSEAPPYLLLLGGVLTLGGMLFKITAFPFHIWVPDIYEGAPIPIVAFFSIVPKLAGMSIIIRFFNFLQPEFTGWFAAYINWQVLLAVIAIITIIIGNFAALWQNNAKRLMAYSSIAHSGFMLIGILTFSAFGIKSFLFYAVIYLFMNLTAFLLLQMLSTSTGFDHITQYKGLGRQYPGIGVAMVIVMIALTGLPPTAGFSAKIFIFSALWDAYQNSFEQIFLVLFIVGLFNTVVSLFYYLKIPYMMFFKKIPNQNHGNNVQKRGESLIKISKFDYMLAWLLLLPIIFLFFKADWLFQIVDQIYIYF